MKLVCKSKNKDYATNEQALQFIIEQQKQELDSLKNEVKCKMNEIATLNRILNEERMLRRSIVRP